MPSWAPRVIICLVSSVAGAGGCTDKVLDASGGAVMGQPCPPGAATPCEGELMCEPVVASDAHVCGPRVELRGQVLDAVAGTPVEGAHVVASDEVGTPVTTVVTTDADGRYTLAVSVPRDETGQPAVEGLRWTLRASASGYQPFPGALRPALPIGGGAWETDPARPDVLGTIDNAATTVTLVPREGAGGVTLSGRIESELAPGTLVIAEDITPPVLGVADVDGVFTLFDVPPGSTTLRGYRRGLPLLPLSVDVGDVDRLDLRLLPQAGGADSMGVVQGSVNIVDAPGGSATSVVLVPSSVFDEALERGPVPVGLRAPAAAATPSITSSFEIDGIPAGRYHVLAAFENDGLVRDPDASIAGTQIQQIEVIGDEVIALEGSFKITGALELLGPGAEQPEDVVGTPTFTWVDDSGEDRYEVIVRDARGALVWQDDAIPSANGNAPVEVVYAGPALTPGMIHQFRVTAWRDGPNESVALSRSEDLRGVFIAR